MSTEKRFLRLPQVMNLTSLSRSSIYRLEANKQFPSRIRLTERATAWRSEDIREWMDSRDKVTSASRSYYRES